MSSTARVLLTVCFALASEGCSGGAGPVRQFEHGPGWARAAAFSRDGKYLAAANEDGSVRVWEVATGRELARATSPAPLPPRDYTLDGAAFSPGGETVAFAAAGGRAFVWRWRDHAPPRLVMTLDVPVQQLAFAHDGSALGAAGGGLTYTSTSRPTTFPSLFTLHARRVNLESNRTLADLRDARCGALSLVLASGGDRLAVTCLTTADGSPVREVSPGQMRGVRPRLSVREVRTGAETCSIDGAGHVLMTFADDGRSLLAGEHLWDVERGKLIRRLDGAAWSVVSGGRAAILLQHFHGSSGLWPVATSTSWVRPVRVDLQTGRRD